MKKEPSLELTKIGIHSLPHELLWLIFTMNSDMFFNSDALKDTWRTSQVCQTWRDILLERPSLWGKLIDLEHLRWDKVQSAWSAELLRRSQGALLWIKGNVAGGGDQVELAPWWTLFLSLISKHWSRIQRLVLTVELIEVNHPLWEAMLQPAPHLVIFDIRLDDSSDLRSWQGFQDPPLEIFSNNAPSLREFNSLQLSFSLHTSWLSNLRSISLSFPFTPQKAFEALQNMPLLEHLTLNDLDYDGADNVSIASSLPHLNLPHLSQLCLSELEFFEVSIPILTHITPAEGCSLSLDGLGIAVSGVTTEILTEISEHLSRFLTNFYRTHTATRIALYCRSNQFIFFDTSHPTEAGNPFFSVYLETGYFESSGRLETFTAVASAFISEPTLFASVQTINLQLDNQSGMYTSLFSASIFPAVEVLTASEDSLRCFLPAQGHGEDGQPSPLPVLFPALKTLRPLRINAPTSTASAWVAPLILFLISRQQDGCPIEILELEATKGALKHYGPILDEKAVGMKVMVFFQEGRNVREAVCGAGRVSQLLA